VEIFLAKMEIAFKDVINVFATNAKNLLLASVAEHKVIMIMDHDLRQAVRS
jgi:hypothetical protein